MPARMDVLYNNTELNMCIFYDNTESGMMDQFSEEILEKILWYTGPDWVPVISRVCPRWRRLVIKMFKNKPSLAPYATSVELAKFAVQHGGSPLQLCKWAIFQGYLETIQYFQHLILNADACALAAKGGHLSILNCLRKGVRMLSTRGRRSPSGWSR